MHDQQLLSEYRQTRSQQAFAELVRRYADVVYAAARRQVKVPAMAEDVAQAVFLLLSQKAGRIGQGELLAGWLLRATWFTSRRAMTAKSRREYHERRAAAMRTEATEPAWDTYSEEIDAAMARLGAAERTAITLRFFCGLSLREVGEQMSLNEDAARKRVDRGLEKLRTLLSKKVVAPSAAGLAVAMAANGVEAAPASVLAVVSVPPSIGVVALAKGVGKMMAWANLKLAAMVVAGGTILLTGGGLVVTGITAGPPASSPTGVVTRDTTPKRRPADPQTASTRKPRLPPYPFPTGLPIASKRASTDVPGRLRPMTETSLSNPPKVNNSSGRFVLEDGSLLVIGHGFDKAADGSFDAFGNIVHWDMESMEAVEMFSFAAGATHDAAVSPDGSRAIVSSLDWDKGRSWLHFLDLKAYKEFVDPVYAEGWFGPLAISSDGTTGYSLRSETGRLDVWNIAQGRKTRDFLLPRDCVPVCLVADPMGRYLFAGTFGEDSAVYVLTLKDGSWKRLEGHGHQVTALAVSPDGSRFASGGYDQSVRVTALPSLEPLYRLKGHQSSITSLAFSPDSQHLVSTAGPGYSHRPNSSEKIWAENSLRLWRMKDGALVGGASLPAWPPSVVGFSPDSALVRLVGETALEYSMRTLLAQDVSRMLDDGRLERRLEPIARLPVLGNDYGRTFAFTADGKSLLTTGLGISRWNATTLGAESELPLGKEVSALDVDRGRVYMAALGTTNALIARDLADGHVLWTTPEFTKDLLVPSPDGRFIAVAKRGWKLPNGKGYSGSVPAVRLIDAETGKDVFPDVDTPHNLNMVVFAKDSRSFYSCGSAIETSDQEPAKRLFQYDVTDGHVVSRSEPFSSAIITMAQSRDGDILYLTDGQTVYQWGVAQRKILAQTRLHAILDCLAVSPDGQYLAAGGGDSVVYLLDAKTLTLIGRRDEAKATILCIGFSPDSREVIASTTNKEYRIWRITSPEDK